MNSRNLSPQWLKFLKSLGIEFWLPLPLLGLSFWFVGGLLTEKILSRSGNDDAVNLQAIQPEYKYGTEIKVILYTNKGYSLVKIESLSRTYTESRMVLKTTDRSLIEEAIAAELEMSREKVRTITRYRR